MNTVARRRRQAKRHEQADDLRAYLEALYLDLPGAVELRAIDPESEDVDRRWLPNYRGPAPRITTADLEDVAAAILELEQAGLNVYAGVATRARGQGHKRDLGFVGAAWCDVDDSDVELDEIHESCELADVPPPNLAVHSGNGLHLYWLLDEPMMVVLDSDKGRENVERLEAINTGLFRVFHGDGRAFNADRILRPPETTNRPDSRKRAKGRVEAPVRLLHIDDDARYSLEDLAPFEKRGRLRVVEGGRSISTAEPQYERPEDTGVEVSERVREILEADDHVGAKFHERGGDDSQDDLSLAMMLAHRGCDGGEIELALRRSREERGTTKTPEEKGDGYFVRTVNRALDYAGNRSEGSDAADRCSAAEDFAEHITPSGKKSPRFKLNQYMKPIAGSQENMVLALEEFGVELRHDDFADRSLVRRNDGPEEVLDDNRVVALWLEVERVFGFRPPKDVFWNVVEDLARRKSFHPVRDYLDGLEWDGRRRIHRWLVEYGGAEDSEYVREIGRIGLMAAVRRARVPGVKYDEMIVLESPQGRNKSTAIAELCPRRDWFTDDLPIGVDAKQVIERTAGKWIVEAGELSGMRKSDVEKVKSFLSRGSDGPVRLAYGRLSTEKPRHFIVVGTTNDDGYLKDSTGNRRFWPVRVKGFDLKALRRDRDQLWAEAAQLEAEDASIRLPRRLWPAAGAEQEARRVADAWEGALEDALGAADDPKRLNGKLLVEDAWVLVGKDDPGMRGQHDNERFGKAIRRLGFEKRRGRFEGRRRNWYLRIPAGGEDDLSQLQRIVVNHSGARLEDNPLS